MRNYVILHLGASAQKMLLKVILQCTDTQHNLSFNLEDIFGGDNSILVQGTEKHGFEKLKAGMLTSHFIC